MSKKIYYTVFNTNAGWVAILGSMNGLRLTTFPQPSGGRALDLLGNGVKDAISSPRRFRDLVDRYRAYFAGHRTDFPDKLDISGTTPFQQAVWQAARLIPYGQTQSYLRVAGEIGNLKATRAVGQALAKNPLPIIVPCHRVLAKDGRLGGFSGGLKMKRFLLELEKRAIPN